MDTRNRARNAAVRTAAVAPGSALTAALAAIMAGCGTPMADETTEALRRSVLHAAERELTEAEAAAGSRLTERTDGLGELGIRDEDLELIEREYNPSSYFLENSGSTTEDNGLAVDQVQTLLGEDLVGRPTRTVAIGLREAVRSAVERNLAVQEARFGPAINEADIAAAEAAFDWVFFNDFLWSDVDIPQPGPGFLPFSDFSFNREQTVTNETGLRRNLRTGGSFEVSQEVIYADQRASGFGPVGVPNPSSAVNYFVDFSQPLLRGFGSDVALAEVRLAQNAERAAVADLRQTLMDTVTEVEAAYWELVLAHRDLVISAKLLERGIEVRDDILARRVLDAVQAQVADAVATVESRRGTILEDQRDLRRASDRLKLLINDPRLPVGSEVLLIPVDSALDEPIRYSLIDSIQSAVIRRPELDQALLSIDNASIREIVARDGRLPLLDLRAQLALRGFGASTDDAFENTGDGEFFDDFALGFLFEQPLGNRFGEARFRQSRLERLQSVVSYRRLVQQLVLEVKNALDDVVTNYRLIAQARTSRVAQAEALRTLQVEKELTDRGFTVERLDVELGQQEALAAAERAEVAAVINYNIAIADLHRAMGTALERNRISFVVPDINQLADDETPLRYKTE